MQYRAVGADGRPSGAWTSAGGFRTWSDAPQSVQVRLAPGTHPGTGCTYPVSLAAYTAQGPDWGHSGIQTYISSSTVYLSAADVAGDSGTQARGWNTLSVPKPHCYGQIDLYGDDVKYDGGTGPGHGPLPYEPGNVVTPLHLIAAWNGGTKACVSTPVTPSPSTPVHASLPPVTPSTNASVPPKSSPSPTPASPSATPASAPSPSPGHPALAQTGASAPVGMLSAIAAGILAIGAAALYVARSRRARRH